MDNIIMPDEEPSPSYSQGKLCVVINAIHAKTGGGVTYLRNMLPMLAKKPEIDVHLFLHKDQFELFYPLSENIKVSLFSFQPTFFRTLIWEQIAIPIKAWAMGSDVVFSPANYGPVLAKNHVILLRNAVTVMRLTYRFRPILYWLALTFGTICSLLSAKKAIAVSDYANKLLTFGLTKTMDEKCTIIHHGVAQNKSFELASIKNRSYLLAVSDIYIQKNYHTLLHAFELLVRQRPGLKLIIIGREVDISYAKSLYKLAEKLNIKENIDFKGYVKSESLKEFYHNCRVFVFPSIVETFGNPLLEAMAAGATIACSKTAAMPEIIGNSGLLFNPRDKEDMATAIENLLENDELSETLSKMALKRAQKFSWLKTAEQTYKVLNEAAEPRHDRENRTL